jgi:hypothetical protein
VKDEKESVSRRKRLWKKRVKERRKMLKIEEK